MVGSEGLQRGRIARSVGRERGRVESQCFHGDQQDVESQKGRTGSRTRKASVAVEGFEPGLIGRDWHAGDRLDIERRRTGEGGVPHLGMTDEDRLEPANRRPSGADCAEGDQGQGHGGALHDRAPMTAAGTQDHPLGDGRVG